MREGGSSSDEVEAGQDERERALPPRGMGS